MMNTLSSVHCNHSRKGQIMQEFKKHYIGEKVLEKVYYGNTKNEQKTQGTVVYVHPSDKWYTVEFERDRGSYRESYFSEVQPYEEDRD